MRQIVERAGWFDRRQVNPRGTLRLLCFPHAGASAVVFHGWRARLPAWIDVVPMHLPGRGARLNEAPFRRLAPLVEAALEAIAPLRDRPIALFGHSVGATIAFEIARGLQDRGSPPAHLFVSGNAAPPLRQRRRETYALPRAELIEVLTEFNGMPKEMLEDAEALDLLLPIVRADFEVSDTYRYATGPRLRCPITAFGGLADPAVTAGDVQAWQTHTSHSYAVHMIPGDHFFIATAQATLLRVIAESLRTADVRASRFA